MYILTMYMSRKVAPSYLSSPLAAQATNFSFCLGRWSMPDLERLSFRFSLSGAGFVYALCFLTFVGPKKGNNGFDIKSNIGPVPRCKNKVTGSCATVDSIALRCTK